MDEVEIQNEATKARNNVTLMLEDVLKMQLVDGFEGIGFVVVGKDSGLLIKSTVETKHANNIHRVICLWLVANTLMSDWARRKKLGYEPPKEETELLEVLSMNILNLMRQHKIRPEMVENKVEK